jgi:hypothetical protein
VTLVTFRPKKKIFGSDLYGLRVSGEFLPEPTKEPPDTVDL